MWRCHSQIHVQGEPKQFEVDGGSSDDDTPSDDHEASDNRQPRSDGEEGGVARVLSEQSVATQQKRAYQLMPAEIEMRGIEMVLKSNERSQQPQLRLA